MSTTQVFKVHYHFEAAGKKISPDYYDWVSTAGTDYNSIKTVLSNNGKLLGPGTLVIDAVLNHPSGPNSVLS